MSELTSFDKLMALELPAPQTKTVRVKRLGLDVTLRELPYDEVERCSRWDHDRDLHYLLSAMAEPDLTQEAFYRGKMGKDSVIDAMKALFTHGEVRALVTEADKLNGYRCASVGPVPSEGDGQPDVETQAVARAAEDLRKN